MKDWFEIRAENISPEIKQVLETKLEGVVGIVKQEKDFNKFMLRTKYCFITSSRNFENLFFKYKVKDPKEDKIKAQFGNRKLAKIYSHHIYNGRAKITPST